MAKINIKLKKKTLLILIPVVVVLLAGIIGTTLFMTKKKTEDDKPEAPPAYYLSKKEELSSITAVVGDRPFEDLLVIEKAQRKENEKEEKVKAKEDAKKAKAEAKEAKKKEKEAKKAAKEDGKAEEGQDTDTAKKAEDETAEAGDAQTAGEEEASEEESSSPAEKYRYFDVEDAPKDVQDYIAYLENEKNFIDIGIKEEDSKNSGQKEENKEDAEDGTEAFRLAGPAKNPESYVSVIIEQEKDSYTVSVIQGAEAWNSYLTKLWNGQKEEIKKAEKKANNPKTSREEAEETVSGLSPQELGLPEPTDQYEFMTSPGLLSIDGADYYPVRAYERQPDDSLWFIGTYLMDYTSKTVPYKYDEFTGGTEPLR